MYLRHKPSLAFLNRFCLTFYLAFITVASANPSFQSLSIPGNQDARFIAKINQKLWLGGSNTRCNPALDFFLVSLNPQTGIYNAFCFGTDTADACLGGTANQEKGQLIMCGETRPTNENTDALILIADTTGALIAQRQLGSSVSTESLKNAAIMSNGNLVFSGFITDPTGTNNMWILCTDSALQTLWQISFGGNGNDIANALTLDQADTIYVLGDSNSDGNGGYDAMLLKISPDGNVLWNRYYGNAVNNGTQGIFSDADGNWIIYGETDAPSGPPFNYWARKVSSAGEQIWEKEFGGAGTDALFAGLVIQDRFYFTGYSNSDATAQSIDAVFCITDTLCNMIEEWQLGGNSIDIGFCMAQDFNHVYFAGQTANKSDDNIFYGIYMLPPQQTNESEKEEVDQALYPNPAGNFLFLPNGDSFDGLYDLCGRSCRNLIFLNGDRQIGLDMLPAGTYICKLKSGKHKIFLHHE